MYLKECPFSVSYSVILPPETLPPPPRRSEWGSSLPPDCFISRGSISHSWVLHNSNFFYGVSLLALRPTPKLEDHPSSAFRDCLFNLFAATQHTGGLSFIRNLRTRHAMVTGTHLHWQSAINIFITSRSLLLRMRNVSDKNCRENQNTHFIFENFFFSKNLTFMRYCWKIEHRQGQASIDSMVLAQCTLDNWGYKHILRICNTFCLYTAMFVARKRQNVMLNVHCCLVILSTTCFGLSRNLKLQILNLINHVISWDLNFRSPFALP
jgi:hypothetical protein